MMHPLKTILFELLSPYGYSVAQLDDVIRLMDAETGKYICSPTHWLLKNRNWFILASKRDTEVVSVHVVERDTEKIVAQNGTYFFSHLEKDKDFFPDPDPFVAQLDASELFFPLTIRTWKEGDYFYPLGMRKKKKIARFLIDKKLSRTEKEKVMVVLSGDRIVWLAGMRIDERVKVKPSTNMIFVMRLQVDQSFQR
jgi:tRNA(Ile)-lysidine synthase